MIKKALIFGASGLIGEHLLEFLVKNDEFSEIIVFNRKKIDYKHKKISQFIIDFENLKSVESKITGDVLFCTLGTTIKKAGSVEAFRKVDLDYVVKIAEIAHKNNVKEFMVVSSIGTKKSKNYYLQTKFEMETKIANLGFNKYAIFRPSLLLGYRKEFRLAESVASIFYPILGVFFIGKLKKYKAIKAESVAKVMVSLSLSDYHNGIFESDRIVELST